MFEYEITKGVTLNLQQGGYSVKLEKNEKGKGHSFLRVFGGGWNFCESWAVFE